MSEKTFPIQSQYGSTRPPPKPHPLLIPWSVAELAYSIYSARYGRSQSLERLAERGGFSPGEMDEFLPDWRERCDEITTLYTERDALRTRLFKAETTGGWVADPDAPLRVESLEAENAALRERLRLAEAVCEAARKVWIAQGADPGNKMSAALAAWTAAQPQPKEMEPR